MLSSSMNVLFLWTIHAFTNCTNVTEKCQHFLCKCLFIYTKLTKFNFGSIKKYNLSINSIPNAKMYIIDKETIKTIACCKHHIWTSINIDLYLALEYTLELKRCKYMWVELLERANFSLFSFLVNCNPFSLKSS